MSLRLQCPRGNEVAGVSAVIRLFTEDCVY
jgi:hypothetical protein